MDVGQRDLPRTFENYQDVIQRVIETHYRSTRNENAGTYDLNDLRQEGALALLRALKTYRPGHESGASFGTYAYAAVFRALAKYCEVNGPPVTVARMSDIRIGSDKGKEKQQAALRRVLLSDLDEDEYEAALADTTDPAEAVDELDLIQHCLERLRDELEPDELAVLSLWACGASTREIGSVIGKKATRAGEIVQALISKCGEILDKEVQS